MRNDSLQLVARWLAAQTGLFLCCFWGDVFVRHLLCSCSATFAPRFRLAFLGYVSSSSDISMGCVPRDFLTPSNSSVLSEAKLSAN